MIDWCSSCITLVGPQKDGPPCGPGEYAQGMPPPSPFYSGAERAVDRRLIGCSRRESALPPIFRKRIGKWSRNPGTQALERPGRSAPLRLRQGVRTSAYPVENDAGSSFGSSMKRYAAVTALFLSTSVCGALP